MSINPAISASDRETPERTNGETATWAQTLAPPYAFDALEPYVSARTLTFHYFQHHQHYHGNLIKMVQGTPYAGQPLSKIIQLTSGRPDKVAIFNNAAQIWNHWFYWCSMRPSGGGKPPPRLLERITGSFGSLEAFKNAFVTEAVAQFGNGGVWLVQDAEELRVIKTSNAETPIAWNQNALLSCDVWEHAYYLDYQNHRKEFVKNFLNHLANWEFAADRLA